MDYLLVGAGVQPGVGCLYSQHLCMCAHAAVFMHACGCACMSAHTHLCCLPLLQEHVYIYLLDGDSRLLCDDPPHELPANGKLR